MSFSLEFKNNNYHNNRLINPKETTSRAVNTGVPKDKPSEMKAWAQERIEKFNNKTLPLDQARETTSKLISQILGRDCVYVIFEQKTCVKLTKSGLNYAQIPLCSPDLFNFLSTIFLGKIL